MVISGSYMVVVTGFWLHVIVPIAFLLGHAILRSFPLVVSRTPHLRSQIHRDTFLSLRSSVFWLYLLPAITFRTHSPFSALSLLVMKRSLLLRENT